MVVIEQAHPAFSTANDFILIAEVYMEFSIGDQVIDPRYGPGQITGVEELEMVDGFHNYFVIEIPEKSLAVRVPIRKMEDLGLRLIMSAEKLAQILDMLTSKPTLLVDDYKVRQARIQEKLKTGRPINVAEVVRDLSWRKFADRLTKAEITMLSDAQDQLAAEMALVNGTEPTDAKAEIMTLLDTAAEAYQDQELLVS
jgi:CarD family transcriptional regulator